MKRCKGNHLRTTYKEAGVDIAAGEEVVKRIKRSVRSTFTRNVLTDIGLFGAFFDAKFKGYTHPVLVSSVDGVGTKLKVAFMANRHDTVGQDLVNHCVNDILVCGATPLYFMDYFATGKLKPEITEKVLSGFIRACRENGCSLIGGETAEMPGFYSAVEYDIAGMIVGVVEKKRIIKGEHVKKGDVLIGLPSNGLHTNGYSLARSVLFEKYDVDSYVDELGATVGEVLLAGPSVVPASGQKSVRAISGTGVISYHWWRNYRQHLTGDTTSADAFDRLGCLEETPDIYSDTTAG